VEAIHAVIDRGPEHWSMEYRFLRADGSDAYVFDRGYVIRDESGRAVRMIGAMIDLTERRQSEAALRESEEFTRRILESSTDCIKVLDADACLRFMSPGGLRVMEVDDFGAIKGCDWRDFWSGPDHEKAHEAVRTALAGGNARFQGHTPTMRGKTRWWDVVVTPIPNPDRSVGKLLSVSRDLTETKQLQEHQRLLINELNHRVKNTLATVQSIASQTLRNAATLEKAQTAFESRPFALSRAHDVLTRENWDGAHLREIVAEAVAPYSNRREDRLHLRGVDVRLPPRMALALAMARICLPLNRIPEMMSQEFQGEAFRCWPGEGKPSRGECPGFQVAQVRGKGAQGVGPMPSSTRCLRVATSSSVSRAASASRRSAGRMPARASSSFARWRLASLVRSASGVLTSRLPTKGVAGPAEHIGSQVERDRTPKRQQAA
jgi:PAS domain S-box-containing protein